MIDFSVLVSYSGQLALVAFVVEVVTEIIKDNIPERLAGRLNTDVKKAIALAVSLIIFLAIAPLHPFADISSNIFINIVAALIASRGSNFVHDFYKLLRQKVSGE